MGNLPSEKTLVLFCFLPFLLFMQHGLEPRVIPINLSLVVFSFLEELCGTNLR